MTQLQSVLLETFKAFASFCKENDIAYFACGGTALGAVRHKGFIPWDDDMDVYVPRKDYDRLLDIRKKLDGSDFSLMCYKDYPYYRPYARFYNDKYSFPSAFDLLYEEGPFIDVIPLDEAYDDLSKTKKLENRYMGSIRAYRRCLRHLPLLEIVKKFMNGEWYMGARELRRKIDSPYSKKDYYLQKFIDAEEEVRHVVGKNHFCYFHTYSIEKELFDKSFFATYEELPFEDTTIRVSGKWHEYLSQLFGDYMQLPPEEKRKKHYKKELELKLRNQNT